MLIASAVDFSQAEQQICSRLGEHSPLVARVQYVSQCIFLWQNTLPASMKVLTTNPSGREDQSNIVFYWLLRLKSHWNPPWLLRRESYCGRREGCGRQLVGSVVHEDSGGTCEDPLDKDRGQLLLCDRACFWFSWTIKGERFNFFFSQQMIFIEFTSLNLLKNFLEMSYFSHIFMNQGGADVQRDLHQNFFYLITMFDNGLIMGCSENITTHLLW